MAEMEEEVIDAEDTVDNEDETETESSDDSEITYEQALEWKKQAERLKKAEAKLVEYKKAEKLKKKEESDDSPKLEYLTKEDLKKERFFDKNPEMEEYRDDIEKYLKKGNTLEEAKILIENSDKTIQNRKKTNAMNISQSDRETAKRSFTKDELSNMSQADYNRARDMIDAGKASVR